MTYAVLADEGRRILRDSTTAFLGAIRRNFSQHLTDEEARVIVGAMNRIIKAHGQDPDTPDETDALGNLFRVVGAEG